MFEFDADGSHQPEQLPEFIDRLSAGAGLVIGSRWVPGGSVENWPLRRRLLSRAGTLFARTMLRSRLRDITSGFRGFRADTLRQCGAVQSTTRGYGFQIELAWNVEKLGIRIEEIPITFIERVNGRSKMTFSIIAEAMWRVFRWGLEDRLVRPQRQGELSNVERE